MSLLPCPSPLPTVAPSPGYESPLMSLPPLIQLHVYFSYSYMTRKEKDAGGKACSLSGILSWQWAEHCQQFHISCRHAWNVCKCLEPCSTARDYSSAHRSSSSSKTMVLSHSDWQNYTWPRLMGSPRGIHDPILKKKKCKFCSHLNHSYATTIFSLFVWINSAFCIRKLTLPQATLCPARLWVTRFHRLTRSLMGDCGSQTHHNKRAAPELCSRGDCTSPFRVTNSSTLPGLCPVLALKVS